MNISKWISGAKDLGFSAISKTSEVLGAGVGYVSSTLSISRLFGSTESSTQYDSQVDEKHYLLVPDRLAEAGYSIYAMRLLPEGVPPLNDLPKRRLIHLPNEHATPTLEAILKSQARDDAASQENPASSLGMRLGDLADKVDQLDTKMFNGVLLIGGLVALLNPVAGAAVALHAVFPSIGMLLSKYGLRYAGDSLNEKQLASRISAAEKEVLSQFKRSETESLVNPLLKQLDRALDTDEHEFEPVLEFNSDTIEFGDKDRDRFLKLTCQAITNTYEKTIANEQRWDQACLGPEDIRYLKLIAQLAAPTN